MVVLSWNSIKLPWATRENYSLSWWYLESWDFVWISWDVYTPSASITLFVHWTPIEYKIDYELHDWIISWENVTWYTVESSDIILINPTKDGYTFTWWSGTEISSPIMSVTITKGSTWDRNYEANREIEQYTITYELDNWTNSPYNITWYTVEDYIEFEAPTKDGYNFSGWYSDEWFTNQVTEILYWTTWDITLYAKWTKIETKPSWGSSGWWSRGSSKSTSSDSEKSNNSKVESQNNNSENTQDSLAEISEWQQYSEEFQNAYQFAFKNWITTMDSIEKADIEFPLTRIAMAKMLSFYAINVLWKKPANKVVPKFPDVDGKLNEDYGWAVDLAYQLWIMWIWIEKFRPYDLVPRSEFGTALSRMLFGLGDWDGAYYETHLKKLKEEWIITNDNPDLKEVRWYVMIMLMRSAK